jgi:tetratricopeptide (TPR) repeat protein
VAELEKVAGAVTDRLSCLQQLVAVAHEANSEPRVEAALHRIVTAGCADETECAQNLLWVAREYEATGSPQKALTLYKRAFEHAPDDALLAHMAELAAAGGLHAEAAADYEQLARRHPDDARWHTLAVVQHDAAMREAQRL